MHNNDSAKTKCEIRVTNKGDDPNVLATVLRETKFYLIFSVR